MNKQIKKRAIKFGLIWLVGVVLIWIIARPLSYLIAAISGVGAAFSLTLPIMLIVFHGVLIWSWRKGR